MNDIEVTPTEIRNNRGISYSRDLYSRIAVYDPSTHVFVKMGINCGNHCDIFWLG